MERHFLKAPIRYPVMRFNFQIDRRRYLSDISRSKCHQPNDERILQIFSKTVRAIALGFLSVVLRLFSARPPKLFWGSRVAFRTWSTDRLWSHTACPFVKIVEPRFVKSETVSASQFCFRITEQQNALGAVLIPTSSCLFIAFVASHCKRRGQLLLIRGQLYFYDMAKFPFNYLRSLDIIRYQSVHTYTRQFKRSRSLWMLLVWYQVL